MHLTIIELCRSDLYSLKVTTVPVTSYSRDNKRGKVSPRESMNASLQNLHQINGPLLIGHQYYQFTVGPFVDIVSSSFSLPLTIFQLPVSMVNYPVNTFVADGGQQNGPGCLINDNFASIHKECNYSSNKVIGCWRLSFSHLVLLVVLGGTDLSWDWFALPNTCWLKTEKKMNYIQHPTKRMKHNKLR